MIGKDADLCYSHLIIKPGKNKTVFRFPWHQDAHYAQTPGEWDPKIMQDDSQTFQAWLAVTPTTTDNGALFILPGEHRAGLVEHKIDTETGENTAQINPVNKREATLKAGAMLVFSPFLPHCSGPNQTDLPRAGIQMCFAKKGARRGTSAFPVVRSGKATVRDL